MNSIITYWRLGGPLMYLLALLCCCAWIWILSLHTRLRRMLAGADELEGMLHGGGKAPAAMNGYFSRAFAYMSGPPGTAESIRSRCREVRQSELPAIGYELGMLRAMVAAAPLLGLLGTVLGMIATFVTLSMRGTVQPGLLSNGISQAMITTQAGLVVALPGLFAAHNLAAGRSRVEVVLDRVESHLICKPVTGVGRAGRGSAA